MTTLPRSALQALIDRKRQSAQRMNIPPEGDPNRGTYVMCQRSILAEAAELEAILASWPPAPPESARACLDSLVSDIHTAMGQRFTAIVDDAQGDISVNTAFKLALAEERQAANDRIDGLLAAAPPEPTWQPIETAPKDGTNVLAVGESGLADVLRWSDDWSSKRVFCWTDGEYTFKPTHWMPLPAPPGASARTNQEADSSRGDGKCDALTTGSTAQTTTGFVPSLSDVKDGAA